MPYLDLALCAPPGRAFAAMTKVISQLTFTVNKIISVTYGNFRIRVLVRDARRSGESSGITEAN